MVILMRDNTMIFDYEVLSRKYCIDQKVLQRIVDEAHSEFGEDEMMMELHIIRALRHVIHKSKQGVLSQ
jgi:hypothetical protein